jgi:hypothetical protein
VFCYPIWFVVHVLAAQSGRLGLCSVVAGNQLFTDNPRQSWLCWPDGKIWGLGLQPQHWVQLRKNASKQVVFNISDLARTARTPLATKTRRNVQKYGFCCPQTGCSGVASLLSESQIRFQSVCRLKTLFLPELP